MTDDSERIVVAGDAHLGAANANVDAFDSFLDDPYRDRAAMTQFVLLGDVLDLVRRDPSDPIFRSHLERMTSFLLACDPVTPADLRRSTRLRRTTRNWLSKGRLNTSKSVREALTGRPE